jgi:hypothetical protein
MSKLYTSGGIKTSCLRITLMIQRRTSLMLESVKKPKVPPLWTLQMTYSTVQFAWKMYPWSNSLFQHSTLTFFSETYAPNCGHRYCKKCWNEHLQKLTESFGDQLMCKARCMMPQCITILHRDHFKELTSTSTFKRYNYFLTKNFVESSRDFTFCPNDCGKAAERLSHTDSQSLNDVVECSCSKKFW